MKKLTPLHIMFFVVITAVCLFVAGSPAGAQESPPVVPPTGPDALPAAWPDEPGAMPELIGGKKADRPIVFINSVNSDQSAEAVTIDVWYGGAQKFGKKGNPQQWVNILGNLSPADNLQEGGLSYVLNGKPERMLSFKGNRRLSNLGDFNIDLDRAELKGGTNTITIKAIEKDGTITKKKISFTYTKGNTWPENYTADWSSSSNIYDIAQVVDGKWAIEGGKLVIKEVGFDRLVAIGDIGSAAKGIWTDYEVTVPIKVNGLDESGFEGGSSGPAVGVYLRWQGHVLKQDEQPRLEPSRVGGKGFYRWEEKDSPGQLELRGHDWHKGSSTEKVWEFDTTYIMKMSVQSVSGSTKAYYRLKFWEQGTPEPGAWDLEGYSEPDNIPSGSLVLVAHHVDAEFGDAQILRLSDLEFTLNTKVTGSGAITVKPDQSKYVYGDKVSLTAVPAEGFYLQSWSGDLPQPGTVNPLEFHMTKDMSITANFAEVLPGTLTVNVDGQGAVTKEPDKESYDGGEKVMLTAVPEPGYVFTEWSGDLGGTLNPAEILINGDMTVTATFVEAGETSPISDDFNRCELYTDLWTFVNPSGKGAVAVDPAASELLLTAPAGPTMTLWDAKRDAPRIMQETVDHDFTVEIKFNSIPQQNNQFQGLLVEQDADNWIRFDFVNKNGEMRLFAGAATNGSSVSKWNETIDIGEANELYMRVSRLGDTWTQSFSTDGTSWQMPQNATSFDMPMAVASSGIFAGNENGASAPDFVARADYFKNTAFPSGITGYLLALDVIGAGDVALDPLPDDNGRYVCNEQVELTAAPEDKFIGWSGDLTGSETTTMLTMDGDKAVTATFIEEYELVTDVIGEGQVVADPDQEKYEEGDEVTLTAVAGPDYYFVGWSGDADGSDNPLTVTMDSDKNITAIFANSTVFLPSVMAPES